MMGYKIKRNGKIMINIYGKARINIGQFNHNHKMEQIMAYNLVSWSVARSPDFQEEQRLVPWCSPPWLRLGPC